MKLELKLKPQQSMNMSLAMQQALQVLQLPVTELAAWVQQQIEENPVLQFEEERSEEELDVEKTGFEILEHLDETFVQGIFPEEQTEFSPLEVASPSISLYDHLMQQALSAFSTQEELGQAENIIGNLDEKGFLGTTEVDADVLAIIQSFDPPGIGARTLQECLLIQLKLQKKEKCLSYLLIQNYFHHLLQGRLSLIGKELHLKSSDIQAVLRKEISPLDFHPGAKFTSKMSPTPIPDIIIEQIDQEYQIKINDSDIPRYILHAPSFAHLSHHYARGKWMEKVLARRSQILTQITRHLLENHASFFSGKKDELEPLSIQKMAEHLQLHESTIARAVKDKYLSCPKGIFPLKYFFQKVSSTNEKGEKISSQTLKKLLKKMIEEEDKQNPLSDEHLSHFMSQAGSPCARRTVAKYRRLLNIPPATHRKI